MDHRIIKYYAGELSKEERKALLQEAFSNQELKKEMINCQHLQSLVKLLWGIERSGFFNGREKWAKGFENQRV